MERHNSVTDYQAWLENDVRYSTNAQHDWRPGAAKYLSASDAVDQYLRLRCEMRGSPAIDYERAQGVDTSPAPENPASLKAHEAFFLEKIFKVTRRDVDRHEWRVWGVIRFECYTLREAARLEGRQRRAEIQRLHDRDELEAWCEAYNLHPPAPPFPDDVEDAFEARMAQPGISAKSPQTAKRYRDAVDAQLEQHLVGRGALVEGWIRDDDDAREDARQVGAAA